MDGELYAWLVTEPDGRDGIIAAYMPALGYKVTLVTTRLHLAEAMSGFAQSHCAESCNPVKLVKYSKVETIENFAPTKMKG